MWTMPTLSRTFNLRTPATTRLMPKVNAYALNTQVSKWLPVYSGLKSSLHSQRTQMPHAMTVEIERQLQRMHARMDASLESFNGILKEHAGISTTMRECRAIEEWKVLRE